MNLNIKTLNVILFTISSEDIISQKYIKINAGIVRERIWEKDG